MKTPEGVSVLEVGTIGVIPVAHKAVFVDVAFQKVGIAGAVAAEGLGPPNRNVCADANLIEILSKEFGEENVCITV